ncbi:hypothetical protein OTU49_010688, partial [Cherax quadricarinatus]
GVSIQGVVLASHCHVTLCVFGVFFIVAGVILSYVSYSVNMQAGEQGSESEKQDEVEEDEEEEVQEVTTELTPTGKAEEQQDGKAGPHHEVSRVAQMRVIGPAFLAAGFLMLCLGVTLFALARKLSHDEKGKQRALADQQLCQLENSFSYANTSSSPMHTSAPAPHQ